MKGLFEGWHLIILLIVVLLLFGAKRLPDSARSLGRSMRIFKAEMRDMSDDDKPETKTRTDAVAPTAIDGPLHDRDPIRPSRVEEHTTDDGRPRDRGL